MARVSHTVCDVCLRPDRPTRHYRIAREGQRIDRDLCAEDGAFIEHLFEVSTPRRTRRQFAERVLTLEQLEELERSGAQAG